MSCNNISKSVYSSDSDINVQTSLCGEQSVISDDEENVTAAWHIGSQEHSGPIFNSMASLE
jgi:hypothetical protein